MHNLPDEEGHQMAIFVLRLLEVVFTAGVYDRPGKDGNTVYKTIHPCQTHQQTYYSIVVLRWQLSVYCRNLA